MEGFAVVGLALGAAVLGGCITGVCLSRKMRHKVEYMLDALEDRETNFRFDEHKFFYRHYHRTLNRIRVLFEREKEEVQEQEHFYGRILERVRTAVVVVDESPRQEGRIIYSNSAALNLLGVATFSHLRQLNVVSEELVPFFEKLSDGKEGYCSYYNEKGKITISVVGVNTQLDNKEVKILVMNNVTDEAVKHEELSWNKLIRVLTHEIMNTVTPIASLSHSLAEDLNDRKDQVDLEELKMGLDTISASSHGLIKFVDNYRSLTRVATPKKTAFFVAELIAQVKQLTQNQVIASGASLTYIEKSEDILLYADVAQISQILVNLVKNAVQAGASDIRVIAEIDFAEAVVIRVWNNGRPIEKQNQEEIFVPFYTTKQEGTGIGLSLSRQIMRLHNGSLELERSDAGGTTFMLIFK